MDELENDAQDAAEQEPAVDPDRAAFDEVVGGAKKKGDDADPRAERERSRQEHREKVRSGKKTTSKEKPQAADEEDDDETAEDDDDEVDDDEADEESDEEDSEDEASEDDEEESDPDEDASPSEYERSLRLLKLKLGLSADDLKNLAKSRVVAMAEKVRRDEKAKARKQKAPETNADDGGNEDAGDDAKDPQDSGAAFQGLRAHASILTKALDKETSDVVVEYLEKVLGEIGGGFTKQLKALAESGDGFKKTNHELQLENFRAKLQRLHPDHAEALDDDRTWGRVVKRMRSLRAEDEDVGEFDSPVSLAKEAIGQVLKDRIKKQKSLRAREQGAGKAPSQRRIAPRARSAEAIERDIYNVSIDGSLSKEAKARKLAKLESEAAA